MNRIILMIILVSLLATSGICAASQDGDLTDQQELGKMLFFDTSLSTPEGMSCASCHEPGAGFADPDNELPVSQGVIKTRFGNRNSPTAAYAAYSPNMHKIVEPDTTLYVGGQFWDGRATDLVEQAKGPFLNPLEMNNPNKKTVVLKVMKSDYADSFEGVTGIDLSDLSDSNVELAYDKVAEAIAAYEGSSELNQFSSKYDLSVAGKVKLTKEEKQGLKLFNREAGCSGCHPSEPGIYADQALFTDYTYDNLGIPKNPDNPFYDLPKQFNPEGADFIDYGLGGFLKSIGDEDWMNETGKMKVPTLRNIAVTSPYMHNGVFDSLEEVVDFYNTRDVATANWPESEVSDNVNTDELGDLGLNENEVAAIVAFLETLTDGYPQSSGV